MICPSAGPHEPSADSILAVRTLGLISLNDSLLRGPLTQREHRVIRLLVTHDRYDRNPVYGGPRDDVIKD